MGVITKMELVLILIFCDKFLADSLDNSPTPVPTYAPTKHQRWQPWLSHYIELHGQISECREQNIEVRFELKKLQESLAKIIKKNSELEDKVERLQQYKSEMKKFQDEILAKEIMQTGINKQHGISINS